MDAVARFEVGQHIVVRDVWQGHLWSATPAIVVEDSDEWLIEWTPAGAIGLSATSRGIADRAAFPPGERQLLSLESCKWNYRRVPARRSGLNFLREGAWCNIAVGWLGDGQFLHWYVNFQTPLSRHARGYDTCDLVIDIVVEGDGTWRWKDAEDFDAALRRGILPAAHREVIRNEADIVMAMLESGAGPFDPKWRKWRPSADWPVPVLAEDFDTGLTRPVDSIDV